MADSLISQFTHCHVERPYFSGFFTLVSPTFNCICMVLYRHNIKTVGLLPRKLSSFLWPIKDDLTVRTPGVYSILCKCGKVYTGQTGHSVKTRVKEHIQHICLYHPNKSAVAEHSINLGHHIQLQNTSILENNPGTWTRSPGKQQR
jgi:hypothetical protein